MARRSRSQEDTQEVGSVPEVYTVDLSTIAFSESRRAATSRWEKMGVAAKVKEVLQAKAAGKRIGAVVPVAFGDNGRAKQYLRHSLRQYLQKQGFNVETQVAIHYTDAGFVIVAR